MSDPEEMDSFFKHSFWNIYQIVLPHKHLHPTGHQKRPQSSHLYIQVAAHSSLS